MLATTHFLHYEMMVQAMGAVPCIVIHTHKKVNKWNESVCVSWLEGRQCYQNQGAVVCVVVAQLLTGVEHHEVIEVFW